MSIEQLYEIYLQYPQVTTDSRNCPPDSIFFALKGECFNGNAYAQKALESGCVFAVVDEEEFAVGERMILVDDCLFCLQALAHHHRICLGLPIVAITGTNGKTTTKELVAAVLQQGFSIAYTVGNLNNHIGVPLTLLGLTKEHQIAIVEMGANHPGEIESLAEIAAPNAGLITNVGRAHLEGFGSFEQVIKTKAELYDFLRRTDGFVFVNVDNAILIENSEGIERIGYGLDSEGGLVHGVVTGNTPFLEMNFSLLGEGKRYLLKTHLIGLYNAENVLAAVCVGAYFGLPAEKICAGINQYVPRNNRSQLTETNSNKLIVDAYNANPTSMQAAIRNFAEMTANNKVLVLGDMRELGSESEKEHQQLVDMLAQLSFKQVYLIGSCFGATNSSFERFASTVDFVQHLKNNAIEGATILIKGSRGSQLEQIIPYL